MVSFLKVQEVEPSISPREFFDRFVSKRTPAVITGLLKDPAFRAEKWKDVAYLQAKAGHVPVMVEPKHKESNQFGTGIQRVQTTFGEFLSTLRKSKGSHHYLTTQYEDDESDEPGPKTIFPPPTNALLDDYPVSPDLMGNLVLEQVNLWVGRSNEGSSSGLHHDFHDNIYCLLSGRKRFVLYPPSSSRHLYPHGKLDTVHPNGLISYSHHPVREDGLSPYQSARYKVSALKKKVKALKTKKVVRPVELRGARKELEKAKAAFEKSYGPLDDGANEDDADAILAKLEAQEHQDSDDEEWGGIDSGPTDEDSTKDPEPNPSSFSRIPTYLLHQHLSLPTTALPSSLDISLSSFSNLDKAAPPYVVDLKEGEMLYLPASWWHEVTSKSASQESPVHMAFNYWFHPPDASDFELPYKDKVVWKYISSLVKRSAAELQNTSEISDSAAAKRKRPFVERPRSGKKQRLGR